MAARSRGLRVFRNKDAVDLSDTDVMGRPVMDPVPSREVLSEISQPHGYTNKVLFGDPDEGGMSLIRLRYAPHYALPRHSHDVDCLYYVVSGQAHLGNRVIEAGDGFFVPANAPYSYSAGPDGVEVLEFRSTSKFEIRVAESPGRWAQIAEIARTHREEWKAHTPASL